MRLVLRAAVRLRLSVGLLATPSNALAFRAVCSRASLPQCSNMFLPSPPPCGGRAFRGGPRPAYGLAALARITAGTRSCGLQPLPSLRSGESRPSASLRPPYGRPTVGLRPRGLHYVPPESLRRASRGFPPLRGSRGAVALIPRKGGNLPLLAIFLTSTCARAPPLRLMCASRTR